MSTKSVYSIRIHSEIKKIIQETPDINWQEEIRVAVESLVREKQKLRLFAQAKKLHEKMKNCGSASEMIREDRDAR
ncbi:MAG: hypothetical protein NTV68_00930 [Methanomicrobiales archaeon]|nr:hypothetical protein [Methanomicrobiales archaeon]